MISDPRYPCSSRRRSKILLAVWRCLGGAVLSAWKISSITPVNGPSLGLSLRHLRAISGGFWVAEDLVDRPPAEAVFEADRALGGALHEHPPADLVPQLHVGVHPFSRLLALPPGREPGRWTTSRWGWSGAVVFDDHYPIMGAVVFDDRLHLDTAVHGEARGSCRAEVDHCRPGEACAANRHARPTC